MEYSFAITGFEPDVWLDTLSPRTRGFCQSNKSALSPALFSRQNNLIPMERLLSVDMIAGLSEFTHIFPVKFNFDDPWLTNSPKLTAVVWTVLTYEWKLKSKMENPLMAF